MTKLRILVIKKYNENYSDLECKCGGRIKASVSVRHSGIVPDVNSDDTGAYILPTWTGGELCLDIDTFNANHSNSELCRLYCDSCPREWNADEDGSLNFAVVIKEV